MVNLDYILETFTKEGSQSTFTVTIVFTNYHNNPERWVMFSAQSSYHMQRTTGSKVTLPALKEYYWKQSIILIILRQLILVFFKYKENSNTPDSINLYNRVKSSFPLKK